MAEPTLSMLPAQRSRASGFGGAGELVAIDHPAAPRLFRYPSSDIRPVEAMTIAEP